MNLTEERKKQSEYEKWLRAKKRLKKKKPFGRDIWHVGTLVPRPGIKPHPLHWELGACHRWTTVEVLYTRSLPQRHILF